MTNSSSDISFLHKRHNVTMLLYHLVFPVKYRKSLIDVWVSKTIIEECSSIAEGWEITFHEIGCDGDHIHFFLQSWPKLSVTSMIIKIKSLLTKAIFAQHPRLRKQLWWWEFWSDGFFASTVWEHADQNMIRRYVERQWMTKEYKVLHVSQDQLQLPLWN